MRTGLLIDSKILNTALEESTLSCQTYNKVASVILFCDLNRVEPLENTL